MVESVDGAKRRAAIVEIAHFGPVVPGTISQRSTCCAGVGRHCRADPRSSTAPIRPGPPIRRTPGHQALKCARGGQPRPRYRSQPAPSRTGERTRSALRRRVRFGSGKIGSVSSNSHWDTKAQSLGSITWSARSSKSATSLADPPKAHLRWGTDVRTGIGLKPDPFNQCAQLMARKVADMAAPFERLGARTGPPVDLRRRPIAFRYSCGDCHDSRAH
jgi:hypothetical protein